jgi:hypothetical protein
MASPSEGPELLLYIAISGAAVSATLVEEHSIEGALKRVEVTVLRNGKDSIRCRDGSKKASAQLLELKYQSFDLFPTSGYVRKLGGLWQNRKMGRTTGRAHRRLHLQISYEVTGPGRFTID